MMYFVPKQRYLCSMSIAMILLCVDIVAAKERPAVLNRKNHKTSSAIECPLTYRFASRPDMTHEYQAPERTKYIEVGGAIGSPALLNVSAARWSGAMNMRLSGMYWGHNLYGAQYNIAWLLGKRRTNAHSLEIGFAFNHSAEDKGPDKNDDKYISYVVGGAYNYRWNHLFLELGPAFILNRGKNIFGIFLQLGYVLRLQK